MMFQVKKGVHEFIMKSELLQGCNFKVAPIGVRNPYSFCGKFCYWNPKSKPL
jgi:hypothetical protein